jgi:thiamine pyrophosphate-dependent acetolactate synthase large subunit-like protein
MKQTADSIHAALIVVWIPVYFYPQINDLPPRLAAVIKDAGILLVDMTSRFREMQRERTVIAIPGNGHMTVAAHQAVAAAAASLLKEQKLLEKHASSSGSPG